MRLPVLILAVAAVATASPALADKRYEIGGKSCGEVQSIVKRDGAAILRYQSPRNGQPLYDRYVLGDWLCPGGMYAKVTWVPTVDDKRCLVYHCKERYPPGY